MPGDPSLVSIWLADEVSEEGDSGRKTIRGLFNKITLRPAVTEYVEPFALFFSVTDVRSRMECKLRLVDLFDLEIVNERSVYLDPVGPDEVLDMTVKFKTLPLPGPGSYSWELFSGNVRLGCTRMVVGSADLN